MKKKFMIFSLLFLTVIFTQTVQASAPKVGTAAGTELQIPMGARNVALGGSNVSSVSGTDALYWNPAGLALIQTAQASFTQTSYFADMKVSYLAAGAKVGNLGVLGLSLQILNIGDIKVTTIEVPEGTGEIIQPNYLTISGSFAKRFTDRINFGTNFKVVSEKIGNMSATGMAFDFGLQYLSPWDISFGVSMKNIGSKMKFDGTGIEFDADIPYVSPSGTTRKTALDLASNQLPASLSLGVGYQKKFGASQQVNLTGAYSNNSFAIDQINVGAEYAFRNMIFARCGYAMSLLPSDYPENIEDETAFGITAGFGLHLPVGGTKLMFDYAYRPMLHFDANQYFSIGFAM